MVCWGKCFESATMHILAKDGQALDARIDITDSPPPIDNSRPQTSLAQLSPDLAPEAEVEASPDHSVIIQIIATPNLQ
jgi:hypothetical protein